MSGGVVDDDDLLAPAPAGYLEREELDEPEVDPLEAPRFPDEAWAEEPVDEGDGGFSDADAIVRVWFDGDRLTKVRVSPQWFRRLTGQDTLERRFAQAFALAATRLTEVQEQPAGPADPLRGAPPEVLAEFNQLPELSEASLLAYEQVSAGLDAELAAALDRAAQVTPPSAVAARSKGVTARLDAWGRMSEVEFEQAWLDEAQVGAICAHVLLAAERAQDRYRPPQPDPELSDLLRKRELLDAALYVLTSPRRDF